MPLPVAFLQDLEKLFPPEQLELFLKALDGVPPVSIRLNRAKLKDTPAGVDSLLPVPWCETGYYLREKPAFTFDPLLHAGTYYVQEASSMFLAQVLRHYVQQPGVMLDLCAAPGGKSTLARSVLPEGSLLVANEVVMSRASVLAENLQKWGHPDVIVTSAKPAELSASGVSFDVILADVPCSGEGMFRKNPSAIEEWSPENVRLCEDRQRSILRDIWPALQPGGLLIYSTCTYNRAEDEENVDWIARELGAEILPVSAEPEWGITGNLAGASFPVYRFLPHLVQGEGFFMAVLRKDDTDSSAELAREGRNKKRRKEELRKPAREASAFSLQKPPFTVLPGWIQGEADEWNFFLSDREVCSAIRSVHFPVYRALHGAGLRIVSAALPLAVRKGHDLIPHPALALSQALRPDAFARVELDYPQTVAYLRGEAITLPENAPVGYVLVTYQSFPLGFVKNIGRRSNNLYPSGWRIRSSYLPDQPPSFLII